MRRYIGVFFSLFLFVSVLTAALLVRFRTSLSQRSRAATQETTLQGKLIVSISDDFTNGVSNTTYLLETTGGNRIILEFTNSPLTLTSGSIIQVTGTISGNTMIVNSFQVMSAGTISSAQDMGTCQCDLWAVTQNNCVIPSQPLCTGKYSCACSVTKKVAVILFNFQNDTSQIFSPDQIRGRTFTNADSVNAFYKEVSFGQISLAGKLRSDGDVFGYYTIGFANSPCDFNSWSNAAKLEAQTAGIDLTGYDYYIYVFPYTSACNWAGASNVGQSETWINFFYSLRVVAHELGHNFGLYHASSYDCFDPTGKRVPISNNCRRKTYGDPFDIMGGSSNHMNNFFKGVLDWYQPANTLIVMSSGNYTIAPIEKLSNGTLALLIPKDKDSYGNIINYYYLEYRQPFGFDSNLTGSVISGISIRIAPTYNLSTNSLLIDMTSDTSPFSDSALTVGKTFTDVYKGITVKVLSVSSTQANVSIAFGPIVILNSASNQSCVQRCYNDGGNCISAGTDSYGENLRKMVWSGPKAGCRDDLYNASCGSLIVPDLGACDGIATEWTNCKCAPELTPTPLITTPTAKPTPGLPPGDLNGDWKINGIDAKLLLSNWFTSLYNLIVDDKVNTLDFGIIFKNWTGP